MTDINPTPSWPNVRQLETNEFATGGANGNMNEQAKALAARSELLKQYAALPYESKTGGYALNERVQLTTGDIVRSTIPNNVNNPNENMTGWVFDKGAYRASWFADSKSESDQSLALRYGYLKAVENGVPFIIDAVFNVNPVAIDAELPNIQKTAFECVSNSVVLFAPEGALKTIPNNQPLSSMILIANNVENVYIFKPKLIGDRIEHTYVSGTNEWGYGLTIYESKNITVIEPDCSNFIGDGIYVGKVWGSDSENVPTNIFIDRPKIDRCRRNGIATTAWNNLKILYPKITNCGVTIEGIAGTGPNAGIDCEPEKNNATPMFKNEAGEIISPYIENCGIGICTYNKISDLHFEMNISGTTTLKNCAQNVSLSNGTSGNSGYFRIEDLYINNTNNIVRALWSSDGSNRLIIDKVRHSNNSQALTFMLAGYGTFENKRIGNFYVHLDNNQGVLAFYSIANGTDLGSYSLRNVKLTANTEITHSMDATNTYDKFPTVNLSTVDIEGRTVFSDATVDLSNYRGLKTILLDSTSNQNLSFTNMANGIVRVRTPVNNSLKTLSGLSLFLKNGLTYDQLSTSTPSQEIELSIATGRDIVKSNTFGWDGLGIRSNKTFDCPEIPAHSIQTTDITLNGVSLGDYIGVSFSQNIVGVIVTAAVTAQNTVTVYFQNVTDTAINPPAGIIRVKSL